MTRPAEQHAFADEVTVEAGQTRLEGHLAVPETAPGIVVFAHGSGSSRHSPRNRSVADMLQHAGLGILLFDLLTTEEEQEDRTTGHLRFDIAFLADRVARATDWLSGHPAAANRTIGCFGASTGAAAALVAAEGQKERVRAIVSRGGRPDLAGPALPAVEAPVLLIVGGNDAPVLDLNRQAFQTLQCEKRLEIVPGASHLFEEPGKLEQVGRLAADWFTTHLDEQKP